VHSGIGAHEKMEENNKLDEKKQEEEKKMTTKRRKKDNPWVPISGNIKIKFPSSSPTFTMEDVNKIFNDLYRNKKKRTR
jgi:hypothetical protein